MDSIKINTANKAKRHRYRYILGDPSVLRRPISHFRLVSSYALHKMTQVQVIRIQIPDDMILEKLPFEIYSTTKDTRLISELKPVIAIKINNHWKPQSLRKIAVNSDFAFVAEHMTEIGYKYDAKIGYYKPVIFKFTCLRTRKTFNKIGSDIKSVVDIFANQCEPYGLICQAAIKSTHMGLINCCKNNESVDSYRINQLSYKELKTMDRQKQQVFAIN